LHGIDARKSHSAPRRTRQPCRPVRTRPTRRCRPAPRCMASTRENRIPRPAASASRAVRPEPGQPGAAGPLHVAWHRRAKIAFRAPPHPPAVPFRPDPDHRPCCPTPRSPGHGLGRLTRGSVREFRISRPAATAHRAGRPGPDHPRPPRQRRHRLAAWWPARHGIGVPDRGTAVGAAQERHNAHRPAHARSAAICTANPPNHRGPRRIFATMPVSCCFG
jgi:hypothetical protein